MFNLNKFLLLAFVIFFSVATNASCILNDSGTITHFKSADDGRFLHANLKYKGFNFSVYNRAGFRMLIEYPNGNSITLQPGYNGELEGSTTTGNFILMAGNTKIDGSIDCSNEF